LFADLGAGTELVGITSGGVSNDCLPTDSSYDTDVYVHRSYIQSIAGADLSNTSCGTIAQVGEAGAGITTSSFDAFGKIERGCRKEVSREYTTYVAASLRAMQSCLNGVADGSRTGPCPDSTATSELADAANMVSIERLVAKCPDDRVPLIRPSGLCAGAADTPDLAACILDAGDVATSDSLASEYADDDPTTTIGDDNARACQQAIGPASAAMLRSFLKAGARCQSLLAKGRTASCPDAKALASYSAAAGKATAQIEAACDSSAVTTLDGSNPFGGSCAGVTTAAALAACESTDHAAVRDDLLALLTDNPAVTDFAFTVPAGAALLRVTLNGKDAGSNDLDLYIHAGSPASTTTHDALSENGGMYEETEVSSPAAGTWYAHIAHYSGEKLISYQLTATSFQP
jgi:hypothetical protein